MGERVCLNCGSDVGNLRDDARYCSGACRQAAYRARRMRDEGQTWVRGHTRSIARPASTQPSREGL